MTETTTSVGSDRPTVFVLYGATGDLAKRMVIPAFYTLSLEGLLPDRWLLVGNGRGDVAHEDFRQHVHDVLSEFGTKPEGAAWDAFSERLLFAGGGFETDDPGSLLDVLREARQRLGTPHDAADGAGVADGIQLIHYLAVPPVAFTELTRALGEHDLADGARVVYEKPFGTSLEGFAELDDVVHDVLDETQVYRIDHFLGKEATQELHVLRFANGMFHRIWNREHVRAVQIDVPESLDITDRGVFYDATGAIRDMLVTHLFQVAAEVAMEPPVSLSAQHLQDARETVIAAFRPLHPDDVVLGQFEGYHDIDGVAAGSTTDTLVAARLWIDTDRWRDVPFLLRTGKQMTTNAQQVSLLLRQPDGGLFPDGARDNVLSFSLSGSGEIKLSLAVKRPGVGLDLADATIDLALDTIEGAEPLPPYVRLIHDVILGDRSLFTRPDGLASAWAVIEPIMQQPPAPQPYPPGSWGPDAATDLAAPDGWLLGP